MHHDATLVSRERVHFWHTTLNGESSRKGARGERAKRTEDRVGGETEKEKGRRQQKRDNRHEQWTQRRQREDRMTEKQTDERTEKCIYI